MATMAGDDMPQGAEDGNFCVEASDDEMYGPEKGTWEPEPEVIAKLYQELAGGAKLELDWKCPGRRSPEMEKKMEKMDIADSATSKLEEDRSEKTAAFAEFDFDEPAMDMTRITPRRTPGSAKGPRATQKRVARLDKIMNDMIRHRKIDAEAAKMERTGQPTASTTRPATPKSAGPSSGILSAGTLTPKLAATDIDKSSEYGFTE